MGTWGANLLENDDALDLASDWEAIVAPLVESNLWNGAKAWEFFSRAYFRNGLNPKDSIQNAELFAAAALFAKHHLEVPRTMKRALEAAVDAELAPEVLEEWENPKERKRALSDLLKSIGGIRRPVKKVRSRTQADIRAIAPFARRLEEWAQVVSAPRHSEDFERLYPDFIDSIEKLLLLGMRLDSERTNEEIHLLQLRLMVLAFYVGWRSELTGTEIAALVKKAAATEGTFPFVL